MPLPTGADQHVNQLLTDLSVMYVNEPSKFAAPQVFPPVPVNKQTGLYAEFDRGDFLRDEAQVRAPATESAGGGYRVTTNSQYSCLKYAYHKDVADDDRANADDPFRPDANAVTWLTQKRLLKEEVAFGSAYFTTGVWTGSSTGTDLVAGTDFTAWDDPSSDIVGIIDDQKESVETNTTFEPNVLVLNRKGWNALKNHPDILDRLKGMGSPGAPAIANKVNVAAILEIDRIVIGAAVQNTAAEGATASTSYIFGNHALLCYTTDSAQLDMPSAGYTFRWTPFDGGQAGAGVKTFRMDLKEADRHEITFAFQHKVVAPLCGAFFQNVAS